MKSFHRRLHAHIEIKLMLALTGGRMRECFYAVKKIASGV